MGSEAKIDFAGEGAQLIRTLKAIEGGFTGLIKQQERMEAESKKTATASNAMFDSMANGARSAVRDIASIAAGWLSIQGAIRLASNEYEKYKQKTATQATTVSQFNTGISAAMQNAPQQFSRPDVEAIATGAAAQAGVSPIMVANALGPTFASGTGDLSGQHIQGLMASAAAVSPSNQEDFTAIAGGAVSFASYIPNGKSYTPKEILGFLIGASRETEVDRLQFYVPEAAKVAAGARSYGLDVPEAIAIFNAITRGIKDTTGELSRTQTLSILKALSSVREKHKLQTDKPSEILKFITGTPGLGKSVVDDLNTRAPTEGFVASMFTGQGGIGRQFLAESFANTPTMAGASATYDAQVARMGGSSLMAAGRVGQVLGSAPEQMVLGNAQQAETSAIRGPLAGYLAGSDSWALEDALTMAQYDLATGAQGGDASEFVEAQLRRKIKSLRRPARMDPKVAGYGGIRVGAYGGVSTATEDRQAVILEQILAALLQAAEGSKQQVPIAANGDRPASPIGPWGTTAIGRAFDLARDAYNSRPGAY